MTGTALRNSKSWNDRMEYWAEQAAGGSGGGGSSAVVEALLADMVGLLQQLQAQTDNLEITSSSISLNADQINLNTDGVETLLAGIDTKLIQLLVRPELQLVETHLVLTGAEQSLAAVNTEAQGVLLKGVKADGSPNASFVQLGSTPGALRFRIYSEDEKAIDPPSGGFIDLSQLLVKGQAGDGIAIWTMNYGTPNA
jgi:hypothetical protein